MVEKSKFSTWGKIGWLTRNFLDIQDVYSDGSLNIESISKITYFTNHHEDLDLLKAHGALSTRSRLRRRREAVDLSVETITPIETITSDRPFVDKIRGFLKPFIHSRPARFAAGTLGVVVIALLPTRSINVDETTLKRAAQVAYILPEFSQQVVREIPRQQVNEGSIKAIELVAQAAAEDAANKLKADLYPEVYQELMHDQAIISTTAGLSQIVLPTPNNNPDTPIDLAQFDPQTQKTLYELANLSSPKYQNQHLTGLMSLKRFSRQMQVEFQFIRENIARVAYRAHQFWRPAFNQTDTNNIYKALGLAEFGVLEHNTPSARAFDNLMNYLKDKYGVAELIASGVDPVTFARAKEVGKYLGLVEQIMAEVLPENVDPEMKKDIRTMNIKYLEGLANDKEADADPEGFKTVVFSQEVRALLSNQSLEKFDQKRTKS